MGVSKGGRWGCGSLKLREITLSEATLSGILFAGSWMNRRMRGSFLAWEECGEQGSVQGDGEHRCAGGGEEEAGEDVLGQVAKGSGPGGAVAQVNVGSRQEEAVAHGAQGHPGHQGGELEEGGGEKTGHFEVQRSMPFFIAGTDGDAPRTSDAGEDRSSSA